MTTVIYDEEPGLSVDDYIKVVGDSTLGPGRPLGDRNRIAAMLGGANLIVTARIGRECVGLARGLTDHTWICFIGDLAVRNAFQGRGIGRGLMEACKDILGDGVAIALLSMPDAKPFYDRLGPSMGLKPNSDAYFMPRRRGV